MEHGVEAPPWVYSFHQDEEVSVNSYDLSKKRKLQYEQLGLPMSKHKFRDRCSSTDHKTCGTEHSETEVSFRESVNYGGTHEKVDDGPEQSEESVKDSTSFVGGYDTTMKLDHEDKIKTSSKTNFPPCQPSTSSDSFENTSFKNMNYSSDRRCLKNTDGRGHNLYEHEEHAKLKDEIQPQPDYKIFEDQFPELGIYADYIATDFEGDGVKQCPDVAREELMLYSNDLQPNAFVVSSGTWSIREDKDARLGARKPTIDQEFEQYFSMLML